MLSGCTLKLSSQAALRKDNFLLGNGFFMYSVVWICIRRNVFAILGAINVQVLTEDPSSGKGTHYVIQTTTHAENIVQEEEDEFTFPEVEITPPSLEDLLQTYKTTVRYFIVY